MPHEPAYTVGDGRTANSKSFVAPALRRGGPGGHAVFTSSSFRGPPPFQATICIPTDGLRRSTRRPSAQAAAEASARDFLRRRVDFGLVRGVPSPTESARDRAVRKYSSSQGESVSGRSTDHSRMNSMASASSNGCSLVRGSHSPSESAREKARSRFEVGEWGKSLTSDLEKIGMNPVVRGEAPQPRRVVTEPYKASASFPDPNKYAGVKPSSSSPYGDVRLPCTHSDSVTQHRITRKPVRGTGEAMIPKSGGESRPLRSRDVSPPRPTRRGAESRNGGGYDAPRPRPRPSKFKEEM